MLAGLAVVGILTVACGDDGVTTTCEPMPEFDVKDEGVMITTGENQTAEYQDSELRAWHEKAVADGCATKIGRAVRATALSDQLESSVGDAGVTP